MRTPPGNRENYRVQPLLVVEPTPLKNMLVKMGSSSPNFGVKIKNIWVVTNKKPLFKALFQGCHGPLDSHENKNTSSMEPHNHTTPPMIAPRHDTASRRPADRWTNPRSRPTPRGDSPRLVWQKQVIPNGPTKILIVEKRPKIPWVFRFLLDNWIFLQDSWAPKVFAAFKAFAGLQIQTSTPNISLISFSITFGQCFVRTKTISIYLKVAGLLYPQLQPICRYFRQSDSRGLQSIQNVPNQ